MDGAEASHRYPTIVAHILLQCVGGYGDCDEISDESLNETVSSADLGGSSKYSNENFED
jgi:hypothetical protein